jgi:metal-dependent amidase/aminoacylase/carboxypeptidase family protein
MTAGVRNNIIPEYAELVGTIRTLDVGMQKVIFDRFKTVVEKTAESNGARAELIINDGVPITYNDPDLTALMAPTFVDVAGADNVSANINATTGAEDFSFYANEIPAMFFFLGGMPKGNDPRKAPSHHTPDFYVDDTGLLLGIKTMTRLVVDYGELKK